VGRGSWIVVRERCKRPVLSIAPPLRGCGCYLLPTQDCVRSSELVLGYYRCLPTGGGLVRPATFRAIFVVSQPEADFGETQAWDTGEARARVAEEMHT
jgi:hypothetical protein